MANPEHLEILKQGVVVWNRWREENPDVISDLNNADLHGTVLSGAKLRNALLLGVNLTDADLSEAGVSEADLTNAYLRGANLSEADLYGVDFYGADLIEAELIDAVLCDVIRILSCDFLIKPDFDLHSWPLENAKAFIHQGLEIKVGWYVEGLISGVEHLYAVKCEDACLFATAGSVGIFQKSGVLPDSLPAWIWAFPSSPRLKAFCARWWRWHSPEKSA